LIDGHPYTVRRLGNLEQLDISQYMRRLKQLSDTEKSNNGELPEAQSQEADEISKKLSNIFVSLFDDGGDQSKSRALVASLSDGEVSVLLSQIFKEAENGTPEVS